MWIMIVKILSICGILFAESIVDIKRKKVHVSGAILLAVMGIIMLFVEQRFSVITFLMSESVGIILYMISVLTEEKLGRGDAIYVLALGTLLDIREMMLVCMISFCLASFVGILLLILKKVEKQHKLAYLPFLTAGYLFYTIGNGYML